MRRRSWPVAAAAILAGVVVIGGALAAALPAYGADVHGDDERDVYVGSGGLILPASVEDDQREQVAGCSGCGWRLTAVCLAPGPGTAFDGQGGCGSAVNGCPPGLRLVRAWFRPPGRSWQAVSVVCLGEPVTVAQVGQEVLDRVEEGMPALRPAFWPMQGAVTQLPVAFSSGQPAGPRRWTAQVAGRTVGVTAVPTWSWSFGDGTNWSGPDPGGDYRRPTVAHAFARPGVMRAQVQTSWRATYVVDGLGPFAVPEAVTQSARLDVRVGEGRAVLVPR